MAENYWLTKEMAEDLTKLTKSVYDPEDPAREIPSPKPILEVLGIKRPKSMQEKIERLFERPGGIIDQMSLQGEETPEEMNDFEIYDDIEPISPYEMVEMSPDPNPSLSTNNNPPRENPGQVQKELPISSTEEEATPPQGAE